MVLALIEDNYVGIAIASCLILFILTNNNFDKRINRLFLAAAGCVLALIVEEAWEAQLALRPVYTPLRAALSALGYSLRPLIPYFLLLLFKSFRPRQLLAISIPAVLNVLVAFSALFCGISFSYTPDNEFVRGPLGYMPFLVAGFYMLMLLTYTLYEYRNGGFNEALIVSAIAMLGFLSTVLESVFHLQFIQNPSIATSITFYYLFLHSNQSNRDALTGALTRRRFYLDANKHKNSLTAVVSLDLNDLKTLNDCYGHIKGDEALVTVANIAKRYTNARTSFYRVGGDEFMMLCYRTEENRVRQMIAGIQADLQKTEYRCAIGYAMQGHPRDFDSTCLAADHMMYEDKRRLKALCAKLAEAVSLAPVLCE